MLATLSIVSAVQSLRHRIDLIGHKRGSNHDTIRMVPELEEMGIRILLNECESISRGDEAIYLAGDPRPSRGRRRPRHARRGSRATMRARQSSSAAGPRSRRRRSSPDPRRRSKVRTAELKRRGAAQINEEYGEALAATGIGNDLFRAAHIKSR